MAFLNALNGYKTYLAAAGLFGLGLFQLSTGQVPQGLHTHFSDLATASLRAAIGPRKS